MTMNNLYGPAHALFFSAMHRRLHWILSLHLYFENALGRDYIDKVQSFRKEKEKLYDSHRQLFQNLYSEKDLSFSFSNKINELLDDTPVESYLLHLFEDLSKFEVKAFECIEIHIPKTSSTNLQTNWFFLLGEGSILWGRKLAGEFLCLSKDKPHFSNLYSILMGVFAGGEFLWNPFLLRRHLDAELEFELRYCPHRTSGSSLSCTLEAKMVEGFAQTLYPDILYKRLSKADYCFDQFTL